MSGESLYRDPETPRPKTSRRIPSPHIAQFTDYLPSPSSKSQIDSLVRTIDLRGEEGDGNKDDEAKETYEDDPRKKQLFLIGSRIVRFLREEKGKSTLTEWEKTLVAIVSRNLIKRDCQDRSNSSPPWVNTELYREILNSVARKMWISPKGTKAFDRKSSRVYHSLTSQSSY